MNAVIVVPYRDDGDVRQRNWGYAQEFWLKLGIPIVVGSSPEDEPFDITKARNEALRGATERFPSWDVALMADADVVLGAWQQALYTLELACYGHLYVVAHNEVRYISERGTKMVLEGLPLEEAPLDDVARGTWETAFAFSHEIWEAVGGFDPRFRGFGHQVEAFFHAAQTLFGAGRQSGRCYHLWHPYSADVSPPAPENRALVERYWIATGHPEQMRALLDEYVVAA